LHDIFDSTCTPLVLEKSNVASFDDVSPLAQLLCSLFETTLEINDIAKEIVFFGLSQKNIFAVKVRGG
jgi:hypothetical protein